MGGKLHWSTNIAHKTVLLLLSLLTTSQHKYCTLLLLLLQLNSKKEQIKTMATDRAKLAEMRRRKVLENQKGRWDTLGVENPPPKLVEVEKSPILPIPTLPPASQEMLFLASELLPSMQAACRATVCVVLGMLYNLGLFP